MGRLAVAVAAASLSVQSATVSWINPAGGDWSVSTKWSAATLPGPADNVVIALAKPDAIVTHSAGDAMAKPLAFWSEERTVVSLTTRLSLATGWEPLRTESLRMIKFQHPATRQHQLRLYRTKAAF